MEEYRTGKNERENGKGDIGRRRKDGRKKRKRVKERLVEEGRRKGERERRNVGRGKKGRAWEK